MKFERFSRAAGARVAAVCVLIPLGVSAQEVTPDNIASRAAQCYEEAKTAAEKLRCVGAEQPACQAWPNAADTAFVEVPSEAARDCGAAEFQFWKNLVVRESQGAGNLVDTIDAARLAENPDLPRASFLTVQLDESQRAWEAYVSEFCGVKALSAEFMRRNDQPEEDCRLGKYGARAVELWQLEDMFE